METEDKGQLPIKTAASVKENTRIVTLEVFHEKETGQSLCILLDNNRSKVRIRVIFAPQENVISNKELKIMYNNISNQISDVQKKGNKFLYCDFNARVGRYIEGNKPTVRGCRKS